jgi:hypothetical protein
VDDMGVSVRGGGVRTSVCMCNEKVRLRCLQELLQEAAYFLLVLVNDMIMSVCDDKYC